MQLRRNHGHGVDAKMITNQNSFHFVLGCRTSGRWLFDQLIPLRRTMTCQTILQKIEASTRKRKAPEADKTKKPKWKSDEIETLIDELEKRSCLWDIFDKEYHNCEKKRHCLHRIGRHPHHLRLQKLQKLLITNTLCCKHTSDPFCHFKIAPVHVFRA